MDVLKKIDINYYRRNNIKLNLYVIRLNKTGGYSESKPCKHCVKMLAMSKLNIKWIYYSTGDNKIVKSSFLNLLLSSSYTTRKSR